MKIIDLLNKIANGEEVPKKISFCCRNFEYQENINDYCCIDKNNKELEDYCLGVSICKWIFPNILNDEVRILDIEYLNNDLEKRVLRYKNLIEKHFGKEFKYSYWTTFLMMYVLDNLNNKSEEELERYMENIKEIVDRSEDTETFEVCGSWLTKSEYDKLVYDEEEKKIPEKIDNVIFERAEEKYRDKLCKDKIDEIIDYLKSKGEE